MTDTEIPEFLIFPQLEMRWEYYVASASGCLPKLPYDRREDIIIAPDEL
jgi:hypothetical protein